MALQTYCRIATTTDTRPREGRKKVAQVQASTACTLTSSFLSLTAVESDTYLAFQRRLHMGHKLCSHHAHGLHRGKGMRLDKYKTA